MSLQIRLFLSAAVLTFVLWSVVAAAAPTVRLSGASQPDQSVLGLLPDDPAGAGAGHGIGNDGRYLVFSSRAGNLVAADGNLSADVFRRDLSNGATLRVSLTSAGSESTGSPGTDQTMTPDGRYIAFTSRANDLVPGDADGKYDVFVRDTQSGTTVLASVTAVAGSGDDVLFPSISDDGRYVAFAARGSDLVAGDTNGMYDIFVRDLQAGTTVRASVADTSGAQSNGFAFLPTISANGRYVAFYSSGSDLVVGDSNAQTDVFVRDLQGTATVRGSLGNLGEQADGGSGYSSLSADGRYLAFDSAATNLVGGDSNGLSDVFVRDLIGATTVRISVAISGETDGDSGGPVISGDGRHVAFGSQATGLVVDDSNLLSDVFVRDRQLGLTTRASVANSGAQLTTASILGPMSANGRYVAFGNSGADVVPGLSNGLDSVYVRDLALATTTQASLADAGGPYPAEATGDSHAAAVADGGAQVAFVSAAGNLLAGDSNRRNDVFVRAIGSGQLQRASLGLAGAEANAESGTVVVSADGARVVFDSLASNLVPGDGAGHNDVFQRNLAAGTTLRASRFGAIEPDADSYQPSTSADGRFIAFASAAGNFTGSAAGALRGGPGVGQVYVHDTLTGNTTLASVNDLGVPGNGDSESPAISDDGRFVAFATQASNLTPGDTSGRTKIARRDRLNGQTVLVSVAIANPPANGESYLYARAISADGRYIAFESDASNLVAGDNNGRGDVFVRDLQSASSERASLGNGGLQANGDSTVASISADGRFVAFQTDAVNLSGDPLFHRQLMLRDRAVGTLQMVSTDAGGVAGNQSSVEPMLARDGRNLAFESLSTNWTLDAGGQSGSRNDVFVVQLVEATTTIIASVSPSPPVLGVAVSINAIVSGSDSNPRAGTLSISASSGEPCIASTLVMVSASSASAACVIVFSTLGPRTLIANWVGTVNYLASVSPAVAQTVVANVVFADGFE